MALYIIFQSGTHRTWNIGQEIPLKIEEVEAISYIQADGHELEIISQLFCTNPKAHPKDKKYTIPMPNKGIVKWFGDIARTIILNFTFVK